MYVFVLFVFDCVFVIKKFGPFHIKHVFIHAHAPTQPFECLILWWYIVDVLGCKLCLHMNECLCMLADASVSVCY